MGAGENWSQESRRVMEDKEDGSACLFLHQMADFAPALHLHSLPRSRDLAPIPTFAEPPIALGLQRHAWPRAIT